MSAPSEDQMPAYVKPAFTVDDLLAYLDDHGLPLDTPLMVNGAPCTGIGRNSQGVTVMNHRIRALGAKPMTDG